MTHKFEAGQIARVRVREDERGIVPRFLHVTSWLGMRLNLSLLWAGGGGGLMEVNEGVFFFFSFYVILFSHRLPTASI